MRALLLLLCACAVDDVTGQLTEAQTVVYAACGSAPVQPVAFAYATYTVNGVEYASMPLTQWQAIESWRVDVRAYTNCVTGSY